MALALPMQGVEHTTTEGEQSTDLGVTRQGNRGSKPCDLWWFHQPTSCFCKQTCLAAGPAAHKDESLPCFLDTKGVVSMLTPRAPCAGRCCAVLHAGNRWICNGDVQENYKSFTASSRLGRKETPMASHMPFATSYTDPSFAPQSPDRGSVCDRLRLGAMWDHLDAAISPSTI